MPAGDHRAVGARRQMQVQQRTGRHGRDLRTAARDDPGRKPLPVRADRGLLARGHRGGFQHVARWVVALPGPAGTTITSCGAHVFSAIPAAYSGGTPPGGWGMAATTTTDPSVSPLREAATQEIPGGIRARRRSPFT